MRPYGRLWLSAALGVATLFASSTIFPSTVTTDISSIEIPDTELRDCVMYNLALESLEISLTIPRTNVPTSALAQLESLECVGTTISDLTGLENALNLREIAIYSEPTDAEPHGMISDLTPLKKLPRLESVQFSGNRISDLSTLGAHEHLETLMLNNNFISDVSELDSLPSLNYLDLSSNRISDPSPLMRSDFATNGSLRTLEMEAQQVSISGLRAGESVPSPIKDLEGKQVPIDNFYDPESTGDQLRFDEAGTYVLRWMTHSTTAASLPSLKFWSYDGQITVEVAPSPLPWIFGVVGLLVLVAAVTIFLLCRRKTRARIPSYDPANPAPLTAPQSSKEETLRKLLGDKSSVNN